MKADEPNKKKSDNGQTLNEGLSRLHLPKDYDPNKSILKPEREIDKSGNEKTVHRARNVHKPADVVPTDQLHKTWSDNEGLNRGVSSEELRHKTVENHDHNSDITHERYSNSHPDNHMNRGNINLDGKKK